MIDLLLKYNHVRQRITVCHTHKKKKNKTQVDPTKCKVLKAHSAAYAYNTEKEMQINGIV